MTANIQEIEAKFFIQDIDRITVRLQQLGARLTHDRILETNNRFDLPNGLLRSEGRVLRLRQDTEARLTYKSPGKNDQGVMRRTEIEFTVSDFEKAKLFLESLGYRSIFTYEKFRTTFELKGSQIMVDELPYGIFIEIEGSSIDSILSIIDLLQLNRETAIQASYHTLFDRVRETLGLEFKDLTFENFRRLNITQYDLKVQAADTPGV